MTDCNTCGRESAGSDPCGNCVEITRAGAWGIPRPGHALLLRHVLALAGENEPDGGWKILAGNAIRTLHESRALVDPYGTPLRSITRLPCPACGETRGGGRRCENGACGREPAVPWLAARSHVYGGLLDDLSEIAAGAPAPEMADGMIAAIDGMVLVDIGRSRVCGTGQVHLI